MAGETVGAAPRSPTAAQQVSFINGLDPDGTPTRQSFWVYNDDTAQKWGSPKPGVGATLRYILDPDSGFTKQEQGAVARALKLWASVTDLRFTLTMSEDDADFGVTRGSDGRANAGGFHSEAGGRNLGVYEKGESLASIDTSVPGFEMTGDLTTAGGYGFSTLVHEIGHILGLGHSGAYDGDANAATDQFSAYDDGMYTVMSYLSWENADAKFAGANPVKGTNWGAGADGTTRTAPNTPMQLDILAIQQLYGAAKHTPFSGGQVYGFNSNIRDESLRAIFDFTKNEAPVLTLYNQGGGNTLDLSGFRQNAAIDLKAGAFTSAGGLANNIAIARNTLIENAVGGAGDDRISGNASANRLTGLAGDDRLIGLGGRDTLAGGAGNDRLEGGGGSDRLTGGEGADSFVFNAGLSGSGNVDVITDFAAEDGFELSDNVFLGLREGLLDGYRLKEVAYETQTRGVDKSDRIIYEKDDGEIFFDRDGSGSKYGRVKFAEVTDNTALKAGDFLVI